MNDKIKPIEKFSTDVMSIWENKENIRKLFAPDLNPEEFGFFIGLGMTMQANPFKREIWAVKYSQAKPAQIFLGRDFYRKKAQEQNDYNGHQVWAVFEKDTFEYDLRHESGLPLHKFDVTKDRGALKGAYCFAYRTGIKRPFVVYVSLEEGMVLKDGRPQATWGTQPVTQIEKVSEARTLRMAWQGLFAGTYSGAEAPIIEHSEEIKKAKAAMIEKEAEYQDSIDQKIENGEIEEITEDHGLSKNVNKLKNRLEKIYEDDIDMIAETLVSLEYDDQGKKLLSTTNFKEMKDPEAKKALLIFEKRRFNGQLLEKLVTSEKASRYLMEITKHDDFEGFQSVDEFRNVDHLYLAKKRFKDDINGGMFATQKSLPVKDVNDE